MTDAERLVVAIRLAVDEARQDAVTAMTRGAKDWGDYRYLCGLQDAFALTLERISEEFEALGKDDEA